MLHLHVSKWPGIWSICWTNWNQKLKLKTENQIFLLIRFRLCYTLWKRKLVSPYFFLFPPYSKCIKKLLNFHLHQQKIFLVFGFSFWFQYIQWIEQLRNNFTPLCKTCRGFDNDRLSTWMERRDSLSLSKPGKCR